MLKDFINNYRKSHEGYKLVDELNTKDEKDIVRFSEYKIYKEDIIAFKNQCSLFKTAGILIACDIYYGKDKTLPFIDIKEIKLENGKHIIYTNSGSNYKIPENDELKDLVFKMYDYHMLSIKKAKEALENKNYSECFLHCKDAAEFQGYEDINMLADCYAYGWGTKKDVRKAVELYRKVIEHKYRYETKGYKINIEGNKYYKEKHYIHALACYEFAATLKDKNAMYNIGNIYYYGLGLEKDLNLALRWYKNAVEVDYEYANASIQLAYVYRDLKDYKNMNTCLLRPNVTGPKIDRLQGENYLYGWGVNKNYETAKYYYEKATYGDSKMHYSFALACKKMMDYNKHYEQLLEAKRYGDKRAINSLGIAYEFGYGVEKDYKKALEYYHEALAVNPSNGPAYFNLANMYKEGKGVETDNRKAFEYYQKASELNVINAKANLGIMYIEGKYVEKNIKHGIQLLEEAVASSSEDGKAYMADLYMKGEIVAKDKNLAYQYICDVLEKDPSHRCAQKAFIQYMMESNFEDDFNTSVRVFEYALHVNEMEDDYTDEFLVVKDKHKEEFMCEFEVGCGKDYSTDKEALYFYKDKTHTYFIGIHDGDEIAVENKLVSYEMNYGDRVTIFRDNLIPYFVLKYNATKEEKQQLSSKYISLGYKYYKEKDYEKVLSFANRASYFDDPDGTALLSMLYIEGKEVEQNIPHGLSLLEEAVEQESIDALLYKTQLYIEGIYVDKNIELACDCIESAMAYEENSYKAKKMYIQYVKNNVLRKNEYEEYERVFYDALDIYNEEEDYKETFEDVRNWYKNEFINEYEILQQEDYSEDIEARLFYRDHSLCYFIGMHNGEEVAVSSNLVDQYLCEGERVIIYRKDGKAYQVKNIYKIYK